MSPAELLPALEAAGVRLFLVGPDAMEAEVPDPAPAGVPELLDEVRLHRAEVLRLLAPPCTSCSAPVAGPQDVLCQACFEARRVLPFSPDRRARTEARLAGTSCPSCGWSWWSVSVRGDASCVACRELAAGRAPRCGTCGLTDGWETVDGRKRCTHAAVATVPIRPADGEACPTCRSTRWEPQSPAVPGGSPLFLCAKGHWWVPGRPDPGTTRVQALEPGPSRKSRAAALFAAEEARP